MAGSRPGSLQGGRSGFGQLSSSTVLGRASDLGRVRTSTPAQSRREALYSPEPHPAHLKINLASPSRVIYNNKRTYNRSSLAARSATGSTRPNPHARVHRRRPPRRWHPARLRPPSARHRPRRATAPTFPAIAACFGTANLHHPRPPQPRHPARRRAGALVARARRNRPRHQHGDPPHPHRRTTARASRPPTRATPNQPSPNRARPSLPPGLDDPELFMPTPEDLERQVRRRAVGRTIAEICAISPSSPASAPPPSGTTVRGHALLRRQRRP